jgi:hypothetical protein
LLWHKLNEMQQVLITRTLFYGSELLDLEYDEIPVDLFEINEEDDDEDSLVFNRQVVKLNGLIEFIQLVKYIPKYKK